MLPVHDPSTADLTTGNLIVASLSGIQDFLFDVSETGGKQAATLRFRSLRLQLIVECIARRVLWALDLPEDHLLYCAAGKFAIEDSGNKVIEQHLAVIRADIETWLLEETHGRLRCAITADDRPGTAGKRNDAANAALQRRKLRPWAGASWEARPLVVSAVFGLKAENDRDAALGRRLLHDDVKAILLTDRPKDDDADSLAGVGVHYSDRSPVSPSRGESTIPMARITRHTPRNPNGTLVEFETLAKRSTGTAMLGILKADADNLGRAIRNRLENSPTFQPLKTFSQKLDGFFGAALHREMSMPNSRWDSIYTVFAGGDDLLLVGPWNLVIDFAAHVREKFMTEFAADRLTISAGCVVVKPRFPIHLAAKQAEELLEHAKAGPKDRFAALADVWRWDEHQTIINAGKQLARWADAGDIQRGWLHTVLELALLRRGQMASRDAHIVPEMACSRLAYHVARNWPNANTEGGKGEARRWIDMILQHFDRHATTKDAVTLHLPAILRYAMLASRTQGDVL